MQLSEVIRWATDYARTIRLLLMCKYELSPVNRYTPIKKRLESSLDAFLGVKISGSFAYLQGGFSRKIDKDWARVGSTFISGSK